MDWICQLQEALNFIESHLLDEISYDDVAAHIYMSSYNFHRTFSLMAGMTANEYIRNRRLSMAAQELRTSGISVIEAALKYGYETPESFSKAFSRFHGISPKQARLPDAPLRMFNPLTIKVTLEGGTIMDYRMVFKDSQRFLALVRTFPNEIINDETDHSIPDFWDECYSNNLVGPLRMLRPAGKRDLYGLCSSKLDEDNCFRYGIGILMDEETAPADEAQLLNCGYTVWENEPAEYVVFKCFGTDADCISQAWSRFYKEFLPQSGYRQTELSDYELYPENGDGGVFCELWIPVER